MKMKKSLPAIIILTALVFSAVGCGSSGQSASPAAYPAAEETMYEEAVEAPMSSSGIYDTGASYEAKAEYEEDVEEVETEVEAPEEVAEEIRANACVSEVVVVEP